MTIAVSGTREPLTHEDRQRVLSVLTARTGWIHTVRVGDCPTGVDPLVLDWCKRNNVEVEKFDATGPWPQAGPIRNDRMLRRCTTLVAFPGPKSKGTLDAIKQAIRKGITVHVYPIGREEVRS